MRIAFDNDLYLKIQKEEILKRISSFGDKLYLEFGGKLCDDYHASRVLPGFLPDSKLKVLLSLKDQAEIVIVVNSDDIDNNKVRGDTDLTYEGEVQRLIDAYHEAGLLVSSVVFSFYHQSHAVDTLITKLKKNKINVYKHYKINGYPHDVPLIVSEAGLGKNEYVKTTKPLIVVTAPGPGSGKMATCLSQLYHDSRNGVNAGYAKYETFPVWNLPLKHPVNLAYEAATVNLKDVNMIDPYHFEAYQKLAVNYNRDVDTFPLLKAIFEKIYGESPYKSPTDMGVNLIGFAICDNDAAIEASKEEIIRRYYEAQKRNFFGQFDDEAVEKSEMLIHEVGALKEDRKVVKVALETSKKKNAPVVALELPNGETVTGKKTDLLFPSAAAILNAIKKLAGIDDKLMLLPPALIEPITDLKKNTLRHSNPQLHAEEVLIALAISASTNPLANLALSKVTELKGLQAHSSVILPKIDLKTFKKLGIEVTEEPTNYMNKIFSK